MATRLLYLLIGFSMTACGPSPWSDYAKEGDNNSYEKLTSYCPLLDTNQIRWIRGPFKSVESEFQINFLEKPVSNLKIELWMPSMGHGSAPVKILKDETSETLFDVSNLYFMNMSGLWEIQLSVGGSSLCIMKVQIP